jgi:hypothetical protein
MNACGKNGGRNKRANCAAAIACRHVGRSRHSTTHATRATARAKSPSGDGEWAHAAELAGEIEPGETGTKE